MFSAQKNLESDGFGFAENESGWSKFIRPEVSSGRACFAPTRYDNLQPIDATVEPTENSHPPRRRSLRIVGITLLLYLVLVGTHLGEFWPFSIYPMFSQAGQPWQRAVVRDVTDEPLEWRSVAVGDLPGRAYPLKAAGVDAIDLANFVSKTTAWNERRVGGLRSMLQADRLGDRTLMVYRVRGYLDPASDSVRVSF
ncbi:MAG: hypothetical protein R3282_09880, partial [Rhodothermales bacterium]|nr:hypothetical protein [Rhodothermales bacterium]